MAKYECRVCGYIYNEQYGGKTFAEMYSCPICDAGKEAFKIIEEDDEEQVNVWNLSDDEDKDIEEAYQAKVASVEDAAQEAFRDGTPEPSPAPKTEFVVERRQEFWTAPSHSEEGSTAERTEEKRINTWGTGSIERVLDLNNPDGSGANGIEKEEPVIIEPIRNEFIETIYGNATPVKTEEELRKEEEKKEAEEQKGLLNIGGGTIHTIITPSYTKEETASEETVAEESVIEETASGEIVAEESAIKETASEEIVVEETFFEDETDEIQEEIQNEIQEEIREEIKEEVTEDAKTEESQGTPWQPIRFDAGTAREQKKAEMPQTQVQKPEPPVGETVMENVSEAEEDEEAFEFIEADAGAAREEGRVPDFFESTVEDFNQFGKSEETFFDDSEEDMEDAGEGEFFTVNEMPADSSEEAAGEYKEILPEEENVPDPADNAGETAADFVDIPEDTTEEVFFEENIVDGETIEADPSYGEVQEPVMADPVPAEEEIPASIIAEAPASVVEEISAPAAEEKAAPVIESAAMQAADEPTYEQAEPASPGNTAEETKEMAAEPEGKAVIKDADPAEAQIKEKAMIMEEAEEFGQNQVDEEVVVYSMLKGKTKYSILCDDEARKMFDSYAVGEETISNGLEDIILLPAQLNPVPLSKDEPVECRTMIGRFTSCPVEVLQPFCFSKLILWGEHIPGRENEEDLSSQALILIKGKEGHIPDVASKEDFRKEVMNAKIRSAGTPVGIDLIAGRIEKDLEACVYAGVDFIILNDVTSRILPYALRRAKNYLNRVNSKIEILVCVDALKDAQELAKMLAMGADFVLIERGYDLKMSNRIMEDLIEITRSTGHRNVHDINMTDICTINGDIAAHTDIDHV